MSMHLNRGTARREFLRVCAAGSAGLALHSSMPRLQAAVPERRPVVLLRSSWQTVNIGDIAHTPGVLALLEKQLPNVEVRLWPSNVENGVEAMLKRRFPHLQLIQGKAAIEQAFAECDFLLHGSGPSLVAERDVQRWVTETGKPFGVFGITLPLQSSTATVPASAEAIARTISLLNQASFVYFRDSKSLQVAKQQGCQCPVMEFGPDGAFATDLRDDDAAMAFLTQHDLQPGKFVCCIPRLRYTPYWLIPEKKATIDPIKHARNEAMKEHDHAPLRQAIKNIVENTDLKVLVCPEDRTQMAVGKELLYDPLPEAVKARVVWRSDYWLTGEALSTYVRSAGLFGNEMHSPIMCIGNGVPAIVCRWSEQSTKGFMWQDIGLGDWLFDFDNEQEIQRMPEAVLEMLTQTDKTKSFVEHARQIVTQRQAAMVQSLRHALKQST